MTQHSTGYTIDDFKVGDIVNSTKNPAWDFTVTEKTENFVGVKNSLNMLGSAYYVNPCILFPKDGPQTKPKAPVVDFEYNNKEAIYKEMLLNGVKNIEVSAVGNPIEDETGWVSCEILNYSVNDVIERLNEVPQILNVRIRPESKQPEQPKVTTEFITGYEYEVEVQFTENPDGSVSADVIDVFRKGEVDSCFAGNKYKD